MPTFEINPVQRFSGSSAAIRRPREITCFSFDDDHQIRLDDSSLKYYYPPQIGTDLCGGFETFRKLDDTRDDHLDSLLTSIVALEKGTGKRVEADVVTWRGMMTKVMAAPFDQQNGFEMNATCFQGTIFIEENHGFKLASWEEQRQRPPPRHGGPSQDMMSYWGYKFETLSLLSQPWALTPRSEIAARRHLPVSNHAQYISVAATSLSSTRLVLGGEVDCIWDCKPANPSDAINFVELKTSAELRTPADTARFEKKLLKFWIQSFLLGVPKIVVGWRSRDGVLTGVEEMKTRGIPGKVKRGGGAWDGNTCVNFAAAWLEWLRETIGGEEGVWRIRRRERSEVVEVWRVEERGTGDVLSREFLDWRTGGEEVDRATGEKVGLDDKPDRLLDAGETNS